MRRVILRQILILHLAQKAVVYRRLKAGQPQKLSELTMAKVFQHPMNMLIKRFLIGLSMSMM